MPESNIIKKEFRYPNNSSTKKKWYVTFSCTRCGKVTETVYIKDRYTGECQSCKKGVFTTEIFIDKAKAVHGDRFIYNKTVYVNNKTKIIITCKEHGDFEQRVGEHLAGHGCKKCAVVVKSKNDRKPFEHWKQLLQEKAPHITLLRDNVTGYHSKVDFLCERHGVFTAELGVIQSNKYMCYECARLAVQQVNSSKLLHTPTDLYYVYFPSIAKYKLGITTIGIPNRFSGYPEYEVVWYITNTHQVIARMEYDLHRYFKRYQYFGTKLIRDGNTELYTSNILPTTEVLYETLNKLKLNGDSR